MQEDACTPFVYMDNSSTTKPAPEVVDAVSKVMTEDFGNPSSLHRLGSKAEELVSRARESVASLIGATAEEIHFTSGGTEANNWALFGTLRALENRGKHVILSSVEHPSVAATGEFLKGIGYEITEIPVNGEGLVSVEDVLAKVRPDTVLVSIMLVQNEVGAIEPCKEIGISLRELGPRRPRFHIDAVQAFARLRIDVQELGCDLLSLSGHKVHGPKGIGALFVRSRTKMSPFIFGGGQETGMRSGTENVPAIVGLGVASTLWSSDRQTVLSRLSSLRERLVSGILEAVDDAVLHGPEGNKVAPYIIHFSFPGFRGESLLHALEKRGVYVSTGSACSSHKSKPSPIIMAMGKGEQEALSSIRFSMSRYTTREEVDYTIEAVEESIKELSPWREKSAIKKR
jgi:cysteine desulfurase